MRNSTAKRILVLILSVVLSVSMLPLGTFAAAMDDVSSEVVPETENVSEADAVPDSEVVLNMDTAFDSEVSP